MPTTTALDLLRRGSVGIADIEAIAVRVGNAPRLVPVAGAEDWLARLTVYTRPDADWAGEASDMADPPWPAVWTKSHVWLFVEYDGMARLRAVPRHPAPWAGLMQVSW
jgi:hypothetical protein